ncbi:MAG: transglutaminase-like cysteine peptidase [Pseudomonadota bacterium]
MNVGVSKWSRGIAILTIVVIVPTLFMAPSSASQRGLSDASLAQFAEHYDDDALTRLSGWGAELRDAGGDELTRARRANDFFNTLPWIDDNQLWGRRDYWATPFEMLGINGGDCEDYSIGKYFTLTHLSVPGEKLLITYVRAPALRQTHMVLAYYPYPGADPYILDNLIGEIRRGSERTDLYPVYSFNVDGIWKSDTTRRGRRVGGARRLNAWRAVLQRMQSFGWRVPGFG